MAHVRRRGPNAYEIRVYLGRDSGGRKKYLIETFHGTRGRRRGGPPSLRFCTGPG